MTNDEARMKTRVPQFVIRSFVIPSSFVIRHSSFNKQGDLLHADYHRPPRHLGPHDAERLQPPAPLRVAVVPHPRAAIAPRADPPGADALRRAAPGILPRRGADAVRFPPRA